MIASPKNEKKLMLTIDVEDWFNSENLSGYIKRESWENQQIRIGKKYQQHINNVG